MAITDHVNISITNDSVSVARAAFGVPLLLSHTAAWAERTRTYTDLSGVGSDFATSSPEYRCAAAMFSQNPHVTKIKIGRAALQPTKQTRITPIAINSNIYTIKVAGEGFTDTDLSYTSDSTATIAEITAALTSLLNGVTSKNYTAVDNTTHITVTGDAAGNWFTLADADPTELTLIEEHADPGVATDLAAIEVADPDWYGLITWFNANAYVVAASAWVNAATKIYTPSVNDSASLTAAAGGGDTLDDIASNSYARVAGFYHHDPSEFAAAATMGYALAKDPGTLTWKYLRPSGISASSLTSTYRTNLVAKKANFFESVKGLTIVSEGTMGDGGFIDVRQALDWLSDLVATMVLATLAGADKIPYTDEGVAVVVADVRAAMKIAVTRGVLASSPAPAVTFPLVADVSSADKTARLLPDIKFSGTLAGAVHKVNVNGVISL